MKPVTSTPSATVTLNFAPAGGCVARELAMFYGVSLAITTALSALLWRLPADFRVGDMAAVRRAVNEVGLFAVWVPVLTAVAVTVAFRGRRGLLALLRRVVIVRVSPRYLAVALLFPPVPQWIGATAWSHVTGTAIVYPALGGFLSHWLQVTAFGAVILLGEEIGWRGFMLPRLLTRFSWRSAAMICGLLWAVWHLPLWVPANYAATGSVSATATILLLGTLGPIALSVVVTWLFVRTRYSIAVAALLHGSNNASMNRIYDTLGDGIGGSPTWIICYTLVLVATAAVFLILPDRPLLTSSR